MFCPNKLSHSKESIYLPAPAAVLPGTAGTHPEPHGRSVRFPPDTKNTTQTKLRFNFPRLPHHEAASAVIGHVSSLKFNCCVETYNRKIAGNKNVSKCHFSAVTSGSICFQVHHQNVDSLAETACQTLAVAVEASSSAARSLGWSRDISEEETKKMLSKNIYL